MAQVPPLLRLVGIPAIAGLMAGFLAATLRLSVPVTTVLATATAALSAIIVSILDRAALHSTGLSAMVHFVRALYDNTPDTDAKPTNLTVPVMYRRRKGSDTWHFCSNCSTWPGSDYETVSHKPTTGEVCSECQSRLLTGNCAQPV